MNGFDKLLVLIGVVFATGVGSANNSVAQSSSLTAFYTAPVASMAPMWIAKEVGFFKKNGLDVKLVFIVLWAQPRCSEVKPMWGSSVDLRLYEPWWAAPKVW